MENTMSMATAKIFITLLGNEQPPYFFIRWSKEDKRYRISASFKYLNLNYGLHINIIRDFTKIDYLELDLESSKDNKGHNIKFLLSLLNKHIIGDNNIDHDLDYIECLDLTEGTQVFFIKRIYDDYPNYTIVFFSLNHWSFNDYLKEKEKESSWERQ
jgi:hypothetical protein